MILEKVVGHIFFSPVEVAGLSGIQAMGLGPMAVLPDYQKQGIGTELVNEGIRQLQQLGITEKPVALCTEQEIVVDARSRGADKAIVLRIEEFGPNLMIYLSPILWQTQNEVLLRTKILDTRGGSMDADTTSHWFRGGPFTLHGTRSLPQDLQGTLEKLIGSVEE